MFKLTPNETASLLRQPESGMGYQAVDAQTTDNKSKRGVVFNAELLTLDDDAYRDRLILLTKTRAVALRDATSSAGQFRA